jgi:hypothetical protein
MNVTVAEDLQAFGLSWFRIKVASKHDIYACTRICYLCYFPPSSSTYFREVGNLSSKSHFDMIGQGLNKFGNLGEVLLMGDLNVKTALLSDTYNEIELKEWLDLHGPSVTIPPFL